MILSFPIVAFSLSGDLILSFPLHPSSIVSLILCITAPPLLRYDAREYNTGLKAKIASAASRKRPYYPTADEAWISGLRRRDAESGEIRKEVVKISDMDLWERNVGKHIKVRIVRYTVQTPYKGYANGLRPALAFANRKESHLRKAYQARSEFEHQET